MRLDRLFCLSLDNQSIGDITFWGKNKAPYSPGVCYKPWPINKNWGINVWWTKSVTLARGNNIKALWWRWEFSACFNLLQQSKRPKENKALASEGIEAKVKENATTGMKALRRAMPIEIKVSVFPMVNLFSFEKWDNNKVWYIIDHS